MSFRVVVNILTPYALVSKDAGREILQKWVALAPAYAPERYGAYEPIRLPFDTSDVDAALSAWNNFSFLVKRAKPRMLGTIFMGDPRPVTKHGWISIAFEHKAALFSQLVQFFMELSTRFEAEFAFLHLVPGTQDLWVSTRRLRQGIPDLYWLTMFGKPYVELFGRERLLGSPEATVEELAPDLFSLRLSDDIRDVVTKPDEIRQKAERVKRHLDNNAFFDSVLGLDHPYSVPEFHIRNEL